MLTTNLLGSGLLNVAQKKIRSESRSLPLARLLAR